jgi:uncharacterized OB-fold protein
MNVNYCGSCGAEIADKREICATCAANRKQP